jgi:MSHA pilin protein MshA
MKKNRKEKQAGFTLIEIIAVLVILAVLAAVAIPRYISLMDDARQQALQGAIAAAQSQCSLSYGSLILSSGGTVPTEAQIATAADAALVDNAAGGDFDYDFTAGAGSITIDVTDSDGETAQGTWTMP